MPLLHSWMLNVASYLLVQKSELIMNFMVFFGLFWSFLAFLASLALNTCSGAVVALLDAQLCQLFACPNFWPFLGLNWLNALQATKSSCLHKDSLKIYIWSYDGILIFRSCTLFFLIQICIYRTSKLILTNWVNKVAKTASWYAIFSDRKQNFVIILSKWYSYVIETLTVIFQLILDD